MSEPSNILIIGNGQLGSAFATLYGNQASQITRAELNLATATQADYFSILGHYQPKVIINTAAYTLVDKAESEKELAMQINANAVELLARACNEYNALLIHYSTDYVFDGSDTKPWQEGDKPNPINHYGLTKLEGETRIQQSGAEHLIFRISWVYDATHHNFLNTMLKLGAEREQLSIVSDQIGAPCYAPDIAKATKTILENNTTPTAGMYHMCHQGETSWHGFASAIFEQAKQLGHPLAVKEANPISTSEYPTPATRPLNSRLDCSKLKEIFGITLPSWQEGLNQCMKEKYAR